MVLRVGLNVDDGVDILCGPDASGRGIGNEQSRRTSTDEYESVEQRAQCLDGPFEVRAVRISHGAGFEADL